MKQTIHCACLKRFFDPVHVVEEDIVDEVEEIDKIGSECGNAKDIASEQEAAVQVTVYHEENDNEQQKSRSPEHHKILEPASVLRSSCILRTFYVYGDQEHVHHIMKPKKMTKI